MKKSVVSRCSTHIKRLPDLATPGLNGLPGRMEEPMLRRAFTLIELLVVVAIIVVLIALLLPSLGKARETARRTACQANLHAIGIALNSYASEYSQEIPAWVWQQNNVYNEQGFWCDIYPYVRGVGAWWTYNAKVFRCPSWGAIRGYGWNYEWRRSSQNNNPDQWGNSYYAYPGKPFALLVSPQRRLLLTDTRSSSMTNGIPSDYPDFPQWAVNGVWPPPQSRDDAAGA
jgi:prepilin-type N-terminal cleavage/methylation domain-containing protein